MSEHPVRLVVTDDLARKRLTVGFRLILVIPHSIWLGIWSVGAFFAALANWTATLVVGRPPEGLHRFLSLYVKYATHVYSYLYLAADPYPQFDGRPGYPVDVEIAVPERQRRLTVAFRLLLALPALLLVASLFGAPSAGYNRLGSGRGGGTFYYAFGVAHIAAILGWFAALAARRMPRGLRDAVAWGVAYGAQLWAYLLVLTSRYPDCDPEVLLGELPSRDDPIAMRIDDDLRRSRLTVFFRLLLAFPHLVWLTLWAVLAFLVAIANWLATLVRGESPEALHRFLAAYVRYQTHVYAFILLVVNPFPGFVGRADSYPAELEVAARARQNRWTVAFRLLLALPAWLAASAYGSVLWTVAFLAWFAALVTGRMPRSLRNAGAHALRYTAQVNGYTFLLTDAYPYTGPCRMPGLTALAPASTPALVD
ncbi:MAG TPA: DUF4389 domain-containing protein [Solirubrobacteraceae bacterium]|jgi:hypothetical protein|nr:DUF4389 domain-containing protein [Solirubrobacteraceae bacterium]